MNKYSGKPNLSQMAQSSWDEKTNIESILSEEQKYMDASQETNDTTFVDNKTSDAGGFDTDAGLKVKIPSKIKAAAKAQQAQQQQVQQVQQQQPQFQPIQQPGQNFPSQYQQPAYPQEDPNMKEFEKALDEAEKAAKKTAFGQPTTEQQAQQQVQQQQVQQQQQGAQQQQQQTPQQNSNQQQGQNQNQSGTQQQQQNIDSNQNKNEDQYILAFNLLQDLDLLRLPEGLDLETMDADSLQLYANATKAEQEEDALQFVRQRAYKDPLVGQLFDYGFYGAEFADLPNMYGALKQQYNYNNYDLSTEEAQEVIVKLYLSDGLDANNARDKKMLAYIPKQIAQYKDENKLKKEAEVAKKYFVEQAKEQANALQQETIRLMQEEEARLAYEARAQVEWNKNFQKALDESKWSDGKKAAIIQEASFVKLNNGDEIPLWQYKQNIIFNDPKLFQLFLDFTSRYDIEKQTFNGIEYADEDVIPKKVMTNLISRIQNKNQNSSTTTQKGDTGKNGKKQVKPKVVNVGTDWFGQ